MRESDDLARAEQLGHFIDVQLTDTESKRLHYFAADQPHACHNPLCDCDGLANCTDPTCDRLTE